jgi:hypothetical protein
MSQQIKGDLDVARTLNARRANAGLENRVIAAPENVAIHDPSWLGLSATSVQDAVLPDATTLPNGWEVTLTANGAANIAVKSYHATTPVLLQTISVADVWTLTLTDNSAAAGVWHLNKLEANSTPARYTEGFNNTTDWGAAVGGYYSITVTQAIHGIASNPQVELWETSGADKVFVLADEVKVLANGDVVFRVTESPEMRFAGNVVIS